FFSTFNDALRNPSTVHWLTDLILTTLDEVRGVPKSKLSEARRGGRHQPFQIGQRVQKTMGVRLTGRVIAPVPRSQWSDGTYRAPNSRDQAVWVQWSDGTKGWVSAGHLAPAEEGHVDPQTWAESRHHRARRPVVRDYIAVVNRGRQVAGPFADYGDAKAAATRARGFVKFASKFREPRRPR